MLFSSLFQVFSAFVTFYVNISGVSKGTSATGSESMTLISHLILDRLLGRALCHPEAQLKKKVSVRNKHEKLGQMTNNCESIREEQGRLTLTRTGVQVALSGSGTGDLFTSTSSSSSSNIAICKNDSCFFTALGR